MDSRDQYSLKGSIFSEKLQVEREQVAKYIGKMSIKFQLPQQWIWFSPSRESL